MQRRSQQRGGTVVEAAVCFLVFFTLLMGVLEFGRAYNIYQILTDAAREGARYSVAPLQGTSALPSTSDVAARVQTFLDSGNVTGSTVSVNQSVAATVNGVPLVYTEVDVSAPYQFVFFPFGTVTMSTSAVMRNENN